MVPIGTAKLKYKISRQPFHTNAAEKIVHYLKIYEAKRLFKEQMH